MKKVVILLGITCALFVWLFGARLFRVDGISMYPSFNSAAAQTPEKRFPGGDYLVIDIFSYLFLETPKRFDVVVFRSPIEPQRYLLKRIIGLPGEQVTLSGEAVHIRHPDGTTETLNEWYVDPDHHSSNRRATTILKEGEYFLLGDNRTNSLDSRVWGALPRENIVGRVLVRVYPLSQFALHPGTDGEEDE